MATKPKAQAAAKPKLPEALKAPGARILKDNGGSVLPPAKKGSGLKIHPDKAKEALNLLQAYVTERVELAKDAQRIGNTVAAIRLMAAVDDLKDAIQSRLKVPLEEAYNTLRFTVVPGKMEDEGIDKITVDDVGRVNVLDDIQVGVLDKEALNKWLVDNDHEDLIKESVNAQTLAAFVRNAIKDGKAQDGKGLPKDNILKVTPIVRAQITRSA